MNNECLATSQIYTTEPMITRALGAEIRTDPSRFTQLLEQALNDRTESLGQLIRVTCEKPQRLDLFLEYSRGDRTVRVGIEAKLDHTIDSDQLAKQRANADVLVLVVLRREHATGHEDEVDAVLTWEHVLECFDRSRLTMEDINDVPATKVWIEDRLRRVDMERLLPDDWEVWRDRRGSGQPAVKFESPVLPNGRTLRGEIQAKGRGVSGRPNDIRMQYQIGVGVEETESDYPADFATNPPSWTLALRSLSDSVLSQAENKGKFHLSKDRNIGKKGGKFNRYGIIHAYFEECVWVGKGYTSWAIGPRSEPFLLADVDSYSIEVADLATAWFDLLNQE